MSNIDCEDRQRIYDDNDIDIDNILELSMFSLEEPENLENRSNFNSKRKNQGLAVNRSMSHIRTPYNSENLGSTWEEKAKNNMAAKQKEKGSRNKSLTGKNQAFAYRLEGENSEVDKLEDKILMRAKTSLEKITNKIGKTDKSGSTAKDFQRTINTLETKSNLEMPISIFQDYEEDSCQTSRKVQ